MPDTRYIINTCRYLPTSEIIKRQRNLLKIILHVTLKCQQILPSVKNESSDKRFIVVNATRRYQSKILNNFKHVIVLYILL